MRGSVVTGSNAVWIMFAAFSAIRMVSYVPQIVRIAQDCSGAAAISYATWLIWLGANVTTALHAAINLHDMWLTFVTGSYGVCCAIVIALTMFKRMAHRRRQVQAVSTETSAP
jgi:hypothetical protein